MPTQETIAKLSVWQHIILCQRATFIDISRHDSLASIHLGISDVMRCKALEQML